MRVIALMNQKGGVGKTTTTANLGAALAELGQRVCLIDLDPQAHLTINYGVEPSADHPSLYDMLVQNKSVADAIRKLDERISLIPSSIDLAGAEIELVSVLGREMILKKRLEAANAAAEFDFILLDCPPSLGLLTINALAVATEVIIPMQPHFLALQGVGKLLETVALVCRRMNPKLRVSGIALTMFDSQTKLSAEVVSDLHGFIEEAKGKNLPWSEGRVFETKIRRNIKLAECPSFGQTIIQYEPASNGASDYRSLAKEILSMTEEKPAAAAPAPAVAVATPAPTPVPTAAVTAAPAAPAPKPAPAVAAPAPVKAVAPVAPKPPVAPVKPAPAAPVIHKVPAAKPPQASAEVHKLVAATTRHPSAVIAAHNPPAAAPAVTVTVPKPAEPVNR